MPHIQPSQLAQNRFCGRHESTFSTRRYFDLKCSIAQTGGNVVPIAIRPASTGSGEIVYGVLRARACLELGLPVNTLILDEFISDLEMVSAMFWENHSLRSLSDFETGQVFRKSLDAGLYPSDRRLAESLNTSLTEVRNCLAIARLPAEALSAFSSVLSLRAVWSRRINEAWLRNPELFHRRALQSSTARSRVSDAKFYSDLRKGR
jgi:ParB family chromosome partitioning protein